ncbi:MAG: SGNH/GDSL hydrolase family protein [Clostridiales bacterium]|nr:SGNH/GDSL hydrolase family protein [Clostridiales bacterium]
MDRIKENTVPADSQMRRNDRIKVFGKTDAKTKILILGNSITWHEYKDEIGWFGDWGMAASSEDNDYVHLLCDKLGALKQPYGEVAVMIRQAATWELGYQKDDVLNDFMVEKEFNADIVLFRLGENIRKDVDAKLLYEKIKELLNFLCPNGKAVLTTGFWKNIVVDDCIKEYAQKENAILIDLNPLGEDESNMAIGKFSHHGVEIHPGDKGMKEIANVLYKTLKELI